MIEGQRGYGFSYCVLLNDALERSAIVDCGDPKPCCRSQIEETLQRNQENPCQVSCSNLVAGTGN
jgi:hypothetical protein